jgi:hypothetical protein
MSGQEYVPPDPHGPHDPADPADLMDLELRRLLRRSLPISACPADDRWLALVAGELASGEAEELRRHLEGCAACAAVAADASRFLRALDSSRPHAARVRFKWRAIVAAAAVAVVAVAVGLMWRPVTRTAVDPVATFVAGLEPPVIPDVGGEMEGDALVYRSSGTSAAQLSLEAALASYRGRDFATACSALSGHVRRFPADREARFLAAVSCCKARELDRAEALLASLAAVAGERRDDARELLERLRAARQSAPR